MTTKPTDWRLCLPVLLLLCLPLFECGYVILASKKFRPGSDYKVLISIEGASSNVAITSTLKSKATAGGSTMLETTAIGVSGQTSTLTFQIPTDATEGAYSLKVMGTGGLTFTNETTVERESQNALLLIQTDKAIYKPNQVVKMRVLAIDPDYKTVNGPMTVSITDKNNNKLEEFKDVVGQNGVVQLEFPISDEPPLGDWTIQASMGDASENKIFKVDEYVLPKFEVTTMTEPGYLLYKKGEQQDLVVKVKAVYTYGKDVVGSARVKVVSDTTSMEKTVDISGSVDVKFTIAELVGDDVYNNFRFRRSYIQKKVSIGVNVTALPTMFSITDDTSVKIYSYSKKIHLETFNNLNIYHPGMPIKLRVKITDPEGFPLTQYGMTVAVSTGNTKKNVTINGPEGSVVTFEEYDDQYANFNAQIEGSLEVQNSFLSLQKYASIGSSTLQITDSDGKTLKNYDLDTNTEFSLTVKTKGSLTLLSYLVISKGKVISSVNLDPTQSEQSMTFTPNSAMSPLAKLVVYAVTDDKAHELLVDVYDVVISNGMKNKVSLTFSKAKERAGNDIDLSVTCDANSDVYVLGVDMSVSLLAEGNDITQGSVADRFSVFTGEDKKQDNSDGHPDIMFRRKRMVLPNDYGSVNAAHLLKSAGLVYITDTNLIEIQQNIFPVFNAAFEGEGVVMFKGQPDIQMASGVGGAVEKELSPITHVRKFFPETWLWENGPSGASGEYKITSKVPDTITTWHATAFSISPVNGLGITSQPAELIAFQPFFVSLNLPYSIRRGENFELICGVYNYMETDVSVLVTIERSDNFGVLSSNSVENDFLNKEMSEEIMVRSNTAGSVSFRLKPTVIGDVEISVKAQPRGTSEPGDQVKRTVIVKPEGFKISNNTVLSVDLSENPSYKDIVDIWYPEMVVSDSKRVEVKVTGDIMGPVLDGLESLLQVPYGCGEQNMIGMVPNIFVASYLEKVGKLTNEIKERAVKNMKRGYQRELKYKHTDGSFSAFGESDDSGSTWLSAFVLKSLTQASKYITIDPKIQTGIFTWLYDNLESDGQFNEPGRVIHQEMLGGGSKGHLLSAYVLIAILESESFIVDKTKYTVATSKSIKYLENLVDGNDITKPYDRAIIAYALTLANSNKAAMLLQQLNDGVKPWTKPTSPDPVTVGDVAKPEAMMYHPPRATSSDVETWAYVVLAYTKTGNVASSRDIIKWLMSQQNSKGGFHSTQDTVVGLQALASFAELMSSGDLDVTLNVKTGSKVQTFTVNPQNSLLLQSYQLPDDTTQVEISATGSGMIIVKVMWRYYTKKSVPTLLPIEGANKAPIVLKAGTQKINDQTTNVRTCVSCEADIGMSIIQVDMPSGHLPNNMEQLNKNKLVKRSEFKDESITIYLDQIPTAETCFNVELVQTQQVDNIQDAPVKAMAYYQTEIESSVMYNIVKPTTDFCKEFCKEGGCAGCPGNKAGSLTTASVMAVSLICVLLSFIFAV
ncbi:CD109 antigen isoform X3 [Patella vulgata]|uniref:CD109 antigen isoform X3 n=2 Tax=Patella vulgata TaxID=6465 RepID=UPI0024A83633|nr:CD109 antigen isoform X3 [Patella vulgata]